MKDIIDSDQFTRELMDMVTASGPEPGRVSEDLKTEMRAAFDQALSGGLTGPIVDFFDRLMELGGRGVSAPDLGFTKADLARLALSHEDLDEHRVTVGGRLLRARPIARTANERVREYIAQKDVEAPSGIYLWDRIMENRARIMAVLGMADQDWDSFSGQLRFAIDSVEALAKVISLPAKAVSDVLRVTQTYRMRLTPYYASLIMPRALDDPILLQSVPTAEMADNVGEEIPPVAADHSPARLVDQFYPRVVTIKATNMCAMYCTHCLRIAHIGKKDRIYGQEAYQEALDYIRANPLIRDVLITGGDAFMLPNKNLRWLLGELDGIGHLRMKRLGTRIPVTAPMRVDQELLDILEESNDRKPVRVVTQINTAQEITPVSKKAFGRISKSVSAVLNQAVLLRGVNDSRVKMWHLCETIQEAYVRPYYIFNCSYRNPQYTHLRVPLSVGRDIVESMYGNISGDAIPRYIATAGGKVPLHCDNVVKVEDGIITLKKPWSGELASYPDANYDDFPAEDFAFAKYDR